jgi:hypothetical protein
VLKLAERQRIEAEQRAAREKQEAEAGRNAKKPRRLNERLKAKQAEDAAWPKRSASPMNRQSAKLT